MTFTPGPYYIQEFSHQEKYKTHEIIDKESTRIASIISIKDNLEETKSNAILFAASTEMFYLLKVLSTIDSIAELHKRMEEAKNLIRIIETGNISLIKNEKRAANE